MWLRGLVAVTCVAVLAAIGLYFWTEYKRSAEDTRQTEIAKERDICLSILDGYTQRDLNNPEAPAMLARVERCVNDGLISAADINASIDGRVSRTDSRAPSLGDLDFSCDKAIQTLQQEATDPTSVTAEAKQAAIDTYIGCR